MIKLSITVMAHKQRAQHVEELVEQLGIATEQVIWDRRNDRWDTGRRAWEAHDPKATHHIVIQDDAVVCSDFVAGLEKALAHVPARTIVSPFVGTRRPMMGRVQQAVDYANSQNASWLILPTLNWGIAILTPTFTIPDMLRWCDRQKYPNYDKRVGQFFRRFHTWPTWYTWPNLVDHRDVPSLVGHGPGRVSHRFVGIAASALELNWSGPVVDATKSHFGHIGSSPRPRRAPINRTVSGTPPTAEEIRRYKEARRPVVARRKEGQP